MERCRASARPICGLALSSAKVRVVSFTAASEFKYKCDTSNARLEPGGLRLIYRNTPYGGVPENVNDLIPLITTRMHFWASGTGFHAHRAGAGAASYTAVRFRCRLCRGARYES
jgi:hypothetical protein